MKFRDGVEQSVWVSFMCSLLANPKALGGAAEFGEAADDLLAEYRKRCPAEGTLPWSGNPPRSAEDR